MANDDKHAPAAGMAGHFVPIRGRRPGGCARSCRDLCRRHDDVGGSGHDRATTTGSVRTQPATPPTVSPPPLTPSQQTVPQPVTPAPDPQANPPRSGGG